MISLHPIIQRIVALGLLAGLVFAGVQVVLAVRNFHQANEAHIAELRQQQSRLNAIVRFAPKLEKFSQQSSNSVNTNWFLQPAKVSLAKASLRTRLKSIAIASGARIQAMRGLPNFEAGGLNYVSLKLQVIGTYPGLQKTLQSFETQLPYLFIDTITMTGDRVKKRATTPQAILSAQFNIFGALQPSDAQSPKKVQN